MPEANHDPAWVTWPVPLHQLPSLLPSWLAGLSPGRSVVVADQIRGAIDRETPEQLVCVAAGPGSSGNPASTAGASSTRASSNSTSAPSGTDRASEVMAMAMLCLQPPGDTATLLHAATTGPPGNHRNEDLAAMQRVLRQRVEEICKRSSVHFVQWATDPLTSPVWPASFGFIQLGTLDYLARDFPQPSADEAPELSDEKFINATLESDQLVLRPLGQTDMGDEALAELVEITYQESLDCPPLNQLRSARQILSGYRRATSYAPDLWWIAYDRVEQAVGCLLMGRHQTKDHPVLELVYMGILPQARGRRYGRQLVRKAIRAAKETEAARLLVAVDRRNAPAVQAYEQFGLKRLFSETVWARSFGVEAPTS